MSDCPFCGKPVPPRTGKGPPRKYCSEDCRYCAQLERQNAAWSQRRTWLRSAGATLGERIYGRRSAGNFKAVMKVLQARRAQPLISVMNANTAPTIVPASYDALTAETYNLLSDFTDRDTMSPPPSSQIGLELECAGLEVEW